MRLEGEEEEKNFKSSKSFPIKFRPTTFSKNFAKIKIVLREKVFFLDLRNDGGGKKRNETDPKKVDSEQKKFFIFEIPKFSEISIKSTQDISG